MSCSGDGPVTVPAKRSTETVPVDFDWHDFLANVPARGRAYAQGVRVRLPRDRSTGLQYECTTAGVTDSVEPRWPKVVDATVQDGSVVWTAKAIASNSLRTTVSAVVDPTHADLTIGEPTIDDLVYRYPVAGGSDGESYELVQHITCANGQEEDGIVVLPVSD